MKIVEIEISNFRLLRNFKIDLESSESNLVFINGTNGRGKTTLLTALRWCFFGHNLDSTDLSSAERADLKSATESSITVTVKFALNARGDRATVKRSQKLAIDDDGAILVMGTPTLVITEQYSDAKRPTHVVPSPENWLETYLPERFEKFILFDGELMYKFFDVSVKGAIENAVREIANIDLLDSVVENLKGQSARHNTALAKLSGTNAEKLQLALNETVRVKESLVDNLKKLTENIDDHRHQKDYYESELRGHEEASTFLEENKRLRIQFEQLRERLSELDSRRTKGIFESGISSLLLSRVRYPLDRHIRDAEEAGRYPADFQPRALQMLLDQNKCLCNRSLEDGSTAFHAVSGVIQTSMNAGELGAELQIMDKGVSVTEARLTGSKENLDRAQKDYVRTKSEFADVQSDLNKLAPKLEGIRGNEDYIREIAGKLKNAEGDLTSLRVHREQLVQQVELAGNDVASAQKRFDKATAGTADAEAIREKVEFLGKAISQAQSFNQQILESVRARLEMYVSEQYSRVKRGDFVTKITEDFEVQTFNKNGVPASLSEGEKMLKAYIFSIALREVVGLKFPLIVDTPFGRLGEENRQLITRTLRDLLKSGKDHQVMFMMHDGEYTPYTRDDFSDIAPFEGYLDWKESESETSLGLGIDPSWLEFSAWKDWADRSGRK